MFAIQFLLIYLFNFLTAYSYNSVVTTSQISEYKRSTAPSEVPNSCVLRFSSSSKNHFS